MTAPLPTTEVKTALRRLSSLDYFPQDPEELKLMVDVLAARCQSVEHVEAAVRKWALEHREAPKLTDLVQVIEETRPAVVHAPNARCAWCDGSGWRITERWVQLASGMGYEASGAERCACCMA